MVACNGCSSGSAVVHQCCWCLCSFVSNCLFPRASVHLQSVLVLIFVLKRRRLGRFDLPDWCNKKGSPMCFIVSSQPSLRNCSLSGSTSFARDLPITAHHIPTDHRTGKLDHARMLWLLAFAPPIAPGRHPSAAESVLPQFAHSCGYDTRSARPPQEKLRSQQGLQSWVLGSLQRSQ